MTENADDVVDVAGRNTAAAAMVAARAVEPIAAAVQQRAAERARRLEVETRRTQREIEAQRQLMHAELRPVLSPTWWNQDATPATAAAAWHLANAWRGHDELASAAAEAIEQQAPERFGAAQFDAALAYAATPDAALGDRFLVTDEMPYQDTPEEHVEHEMQAECPCGTVLPSLDPESYETGHDMYVTDPHAVRKQHEIQHGPPTYTPVSAGTSRQVDATHVRVEAVTASVEGLDALGARGRIVAAKGSAHRPAAAARAAHGATPGSKAVGRMHQVVRERDQGL